MQRISQTKLARRNYLVEESYIQELQKLLGLASASETIRRAVKDRLIAEKFKTVARRITKRGGLRDVYGKPSK